MTLTTSPFELVRAISPNSGRTESAAMNNSSTGATSFMRDSGRSESAQSAESARQKSPSTAAGAGPWAKLRHVNVNAAVKYHRQRWWLDLCGRKPQKARNVGRPLIMKSFPGSVALVNL
jgi:hypothetical protein